MVRLARGRPTFELWELIFDFISSVNQSQDEAAGNRKGCEFTIEDESGTVNVICWPNLVEQQRKELMGAKLFGVYGVWQCERNVRHLVAKRLVDLSHMLGELDTRSRNFH
jgi:error-prone DNA polymerase